MAGVTGIGGVFVAVKDRAGQRKWYQEKLGINITDYGTQFFIKDDPHGINGCTVFSHFDEGSDYLKPGTANFMINFRVDDLEAYVGELKDRGVDIIGDIVDEPYGKFAWVLDPEGLKVEFWEQKEMPPEPENHGSAS